MNIFGVSIENKSANEVFYQINNSLNNNKSSIFIATLNNEILLKASEDESYKDILNSADLRIVDSIGIKLISLFKRKRVGNRIAGADLARYILEKAIERRMSVAAIIPENDWGWSSEDDIQKALNKCNNLTIISRERKNRRVNHDAKKLLATEILFVGLGAPYQERYIWKIKNKLPKLKIAIGIGGTFDYWTKRKKRAPKIMRKIGMEWFWRFLIQPNRATRIWNATILFPWKALRNK